MSNSLTPLTNEINRLRRKLESAISYEDIVRLINEIDALSNNGIASEESAGDTKREQQKQRDEKMEKARLAGIRKAQKTYRKRIERDNRQSIDDFISEVSAAGYAEKRGENISGKPSSDYYSKGILHSSPEIEEAIERYNSRPFDEQWARQERADDMLALLCRHGLLEDTLWYSK